MTTQITSEEIKKLSTYQLRIRVAILCGWEATVEDNGGKCIPIIPDYPNDLNAMHEAEAKFLTYKQTITYTEWLEKLNGFAGNVNIPVWHASAHHKAVAFVLTMEKIND